MEDRRCTRAGVSLTVTCDAANPFRTLTTRSPRATASIEIEIEIVNNNTSINRLLSLGPPCTMPNWTYKQE
jgi:hypothetical protein